MTLASNHRQHWHRCIASARVARKATILWKFDEQLDQVLDAVKQKPVEVVVHAGGKDHKGLAFVRRFVAQLRSAIADLRVVEVALLMQAGDTIAWQRTLSGTHEAEPAGIPPSRKKGEWGEMVVTRFDGETIAEEWTVSDLAGQLMIKLPRA